ncbi:MAG: nucleotidyl transferase AbiEii/AbiGii toxin family protein [Candidatus Hadarchaeales archaeon]
MEKLRRVFLGAKIKRRHHREVALAQDIVVEIFSSLFPRGVLYGGTAIWRCYSGNRFSEDIDVYMEKNLGKIDEMFQMLEKRGFTVVKKRIKENSLYSTLKLGDAEVRLEASFRRVDGIIAEYETCEGNLLSVRTLPPDILLDEKIEAYLARRKVRDLYDAFFLLRHLEKTEKIKSELLKLVQNYKPPVDEKELKVLILFGLVPSANDMIEYIKRWAG